MSKVLHLTLYKKHFDEILSGKKKTEYREFTRHWDQRILYKNFDYIHFVNGFGKKRPWVDVEFKMAGLDIPTNQIVISLGNILKSGNLKNE
jgi:hypothetical protein